MPAKRLGYLVAAAVNGVMLWAVHRLLDRGWPAFLTDDFEQVPGVVTASSIAGIVVNVVPATHTGVTGSRPLRSVGQAV